MKSKKCLKIIGVVLFLAMTALILLYLMFWKTENEPMPDITFFYFDYGGNDLLIGADGSIYAAKSKDVGSIPIDEMVQRIHQKDYEDILERVGTTNAAKVQKMYNLFVEVVVRGDYWLDYNTIVPNETGTNLGHKAVAYWYGVYEEADGRLTNRRIFSTKEDYACSDQRGYRLVEWMDKTLDKYKK